MKKSDPVYGCDVYRDDLQEVEKAKRAWNQYLKVPPTGQGADNIMTILDYL